MFELASLLKETTKCPENFSGNFRCTGLAKIPPNSWSGATKCPEKFSAVLSVMSLSVSIRDITDKSRKYFSVHIVALKQTFSIFWTFTGHLAALNQNFEHNFLFGATKCPEKYFRNLSVMSLLQAFSIWVFPAYIQSDSGHWLNTKGSKHKEHTRSQPTLLSTECYRYLQWPTLHALTSIEQCEY